MVKWLAIHKSFLPMCFFPFTVFTLCPQQFQSQTISSKNSIPTSNVHSSTVTRSLSECHILNKGINYNWWDSDFEHLLITGHERMWSFNTHCIKFKGGSYTSIYTSHGHFMHSLIFSKTTHQNSTKLSATDSFICLHVICLQ